MALLLAGLLALQPVAGAADWWYVSASGPVGDQDAFYADRASIRRDGDHVFISEAREGETVANGILAARLDVEYDCRARTGRFVIATFLGPDGSIVEESDPHETLHPVEHGSVYQKMMGFACGDEAGLERLGALDLREHALLLFRERAARAPAAN